MKAPLQAAPRRQSPQRGAAGCIMVVLLLLLGLGGAGALAMKRTNAMADKEKQVNNTWREVHIQYARRLDLVRRLMATPEGQHLRGTGLAQGVGRGRTEIEESQLAEIPRPRSQEALGAFLDAQERFTLGLSRVTDQMRQGAGANPSEAFTKVMTELEFTTSRIRLARRDYYDAIWAYNSSLLSFPDVFLAKLAGYRRSPQPEVRIPGETNEEALFEEFVSAGQG